MTKNMWVVAGLSLGLLAAAPVFAQGGAEMARDKADCAKGERMGKAHMHKSGPKLDQLEQSLALNAEQRPAWERFESTVREQVEQRKTGRESRHEKAADGETDRMAAHIARMESRLEGMKRIQKARQGLFEVLSPEQREKAEAFFQSRHRHHG